MTWIAIGVLYGQTGANTVHLYADFDTEPIGEPFETGGAALGQVTFYSLDEHEFQTGTVIGAGLSNLHSGMATDDEDVGRLGILAGGSRLVPASLVLVALRTADAAGAAVQP